MHPLFQALEARGWTVKPRTGSHDALLPAVVAGRYDKLPQEVSLFLSAIEVCCNGAGDVWFLTADDYARMRGLGYCWNEYEHMSLDSAKNDQLWRKEITAFWDDHFPFMLAVHSDYDYLAVRLTSDGFGSVVHGYAPEWDSPESIAPSFSAFLEAFTAATNAAESKYPFTIFR